MDLMRIKSTIRDKVSQSNSLINTNSNLINYINSKTGYKLTFK